MALKQLSDVAAAIEIPVIGMGGISSGTEALELIDFGATAVAVGTETFRDPAAGARIRAGLEAALAARAAAS